MPSLRISALPLKTALDLTDIVPIIDAQYGAENYVSKRTTVGSIIDLAQDYFVAKIDFGSIVSTVNGYSGNVILDLSVLGDLALSNLANNDLLAYDGTQQKWTNKSVENEVLDCGTF